MTDKELGNPENESFEEKPEETNSEKNESIENEVVEDELIVDEPILSTTESLNSDETAVLFQNQDNQNPSNQVSAIAPPSNSSPKLWMGLSLLLAIVLVIVLIKPPFGGNGGTTAVATVNGVDITKETLYNELVTLGGTQTLDNLITEQLIEQEVTKAKVTVSEEDVTKELDTIKKNFGTEEEFTAALTQMGMTLDNLKKEMQIQVKIRKLVEPQVKVTDEDIKAFFESNADTFGTATLEESSADIKEMLTGQQLSTLSSEWIAGLKSKADIKNTLVTDVKTPETTTDEPTTDEPVTEPVK
ncbi:SurA N-terminal domain-containing protein [Paenibacillus sp. FA6]|uniref:SurA N-terminal domain-containing protein n=1 Tax=Paenibacillus sp. FA6 TaxID=3413029 RepID=UPI003F65B48F